MWELFFTALVEFLMTWLTEFLAAFAPAVG